MPESGAKQTMAMETLKINVFSGQILNRQAIIMDVVFKTWRNQYHPLFIESSAQEIIFILYNSQFTTHFAGNLMTT